MCICIDRVLGIMLWYLQERESYISLPNIISKAPKLLLLICNLRQIYFENSKNLEEFYQNSEKILKRFHAYSEKYPNLKFLVKQKSEESKTCLFLKMMNKTQGRMFVETVDKGVQTPTHIIEKHIGSPPFRLQTKLI